MGEKQAEDEKDPSGWWGHTSKLCKAVNCGRSARGEPTPSPTSHQLPGVTAPLPTGRHSSPAGSSCSASWSICFQQLRDESLE